MLIARTPVRVSFAGGGTDLPSYYLPHGGMVLSTTINKYVYTILTKREDRLTQIISSDFRAIESYEDIAQRTFTGSELEIPWASLKFLQFQGGVNLFLASEIAAGTGLGSSASVCVNLLKILSSHLGVKWSKQELAEHAFTVARELLHRPVGKQDEFAATFGGLNFFAFNRDGVHVESISLSPDILAALESNLMLFFTGTARNSFDILSVQDQRTAQADPQVVEALHRQKELVRPMREALQGGELDRLGELLHEAWEIKKRVSSSISSSRIDEIYLCARQYGALGGKITGAGGGGFLLLYCPQERQAAVREALAQFNMKEMLFGFDSHGSRIVYDDPLFDSDRRGGIRWLFTRS